MISMRASCAAGPSSSPSSVQLLSTYIPGDCPMGKELRFGDDVRRLRLSRVDQRASVATRGIQR